MPLAFVTGSTGFVGQNLIEALGRDGWDVIAMHRAHSDIAYLAQLGVTLQCGDVTQLDSIRSAMPQRPDVVFHVAGDTSLWRRQRAEQTLVNVRGTRNVVRVALERRARRFVHTSSAVAFGLHSGRINEQTPVSAAKSPIDYVRTKAMAEREVRRGIARGLPGVIINPANILGRYDHNNWSRLFQLVQQRRLPGMPDGGGSFCHANSVAQAHLAAAQQGRIGSNYLLGGEDAAYLTLVKRVAKALGRTVAPRPLPVAVLSAYARLEETLAPVFRREPDLTRETVTLLSSNIYCDTSRAVDELGFECVDMDSMLNDTIEWMLSEGMLKSISRSIPSA